MNVKIDFDNINVFEENNPNNIKILMLKGEKGDTGSGADWGNIGGTITNQTDLMSQLNSKANSNDLSTVAISGSYNDLSNKPTIPDVNNMGNIVVDGIEGKNLYNATKASYATNAVTYGADTNKLYMNGTPSADARIQFGKSIYLKRGTYTFSMTLSSGTINRNTTFYLYSGTNSTEISWTVVSSLTVTPTINNVATVTFNVANGGYIFLANYLYTNQTFTNAEFNYIIEKGDKFTGFISYDTYANSKREEYSTGEEKIGRWIDGKQLYRKVVDFGALPNASSKLVAHNISNIGTVVDIKGTAYSNTYGTRIPWNFAPYNQSIQITNTNIQVTNNTNASTFTGYVTIDYTKTTD